MPTAVTFPQHRGRGRDASFLSPKVKSSELGHSFPTPSIVPRHTGSGLHCLQDKLLVIVEGPPLRDFWFTLWIQQ